ncbi:S8 family serine peptidase [Aegicerativicinus sediminis]
MKFKNLKMAMVILSVMAVVNCSEDSMNTELVEIEPFSVESQEMSNQYVVTFVDGTLSRMANRSKTRVEYENSMDALKLEVSDKFKNANIKEELIKNTFGFALQGFVAELSDKQLEQLKNDPRVKSIEKDYLITLAPPPGKGPGSGGGGGGSDPTQVTPWGITRVGGAIDGTGKTAWIIDSGIDFDHPDLNVDISRSRSFVTTGKDSQDANDGNGHGTHVAGTVAALDNGIGVIGVAPGAKVVACKVLDRRGSGQFSWTIAALDYVASVGNSGDAVNMSLGPQSRYTDSAVDDAARGVASRGIKVAIAAGNSNDDALYYSPARAGLNNNNIYTVSAMDNGDVMASFSNYGTPVDYAAPGVSILSTYKDGGYATASGTSMASPHVCGLLLLGNIVSDGTITGDKDNNPDPIATHN